MTVLSTQVSDRDQRATAAVLNKQVKNEMTEIHRVEGTTSKGNYSEACRGVGVTW